MPHKSVFLWKSRGLNPLFFDVLETAKFGDLGEKVNTRKPNNKFGSAKFPEKNGLVNIELEFSESAPEPEKNQIVLFQDPQEKTKK